MRFRVVFLTQKLPSTSWIVTYHVFVAGFAFPNILNDWVLSISELQSDDSGDPDDSEDDAQSDSSEMGDFIEHSCEVLYVFTEWGLCVFRESWRDILRVRTLFILYPYDSFFIINMLFYPQSAFYPRSAVCTDLRFTLSDRL